MKSCFKNLKLILVAVVSLSFFVLSCGDSPTQPKDPDPPSNFDVDRPGNMRIQLLWDDSPTSSVDHYVLERRRNDESFRAIAEVEHGIEMYVDTVDSYEDEFYYRITAVDRNGLKSLTIKREGSVLAPNLGSPRPLDSIKVGARNFGGTTSITVNWKAFDFDIEEFHIYKYIDDEIVDTLKKEGRFVSSLVDEDIEPGVMYGYTVSAVDFGGRKSSGSPEGKDVALLEATLVDPVRGETLGSSSVEFKWEPVEYATHYEVRIYQGEVDPILLGTFEKDASSSETVYERLTIDLDDVDDISIAMNISWRVFAFSKVDGGYNSISSLETFSIE